MDDGGDNNLLFRLGFEEHPRSGAQLEALARAVELTQDRISKVFTSVGDQVRTTADRIKAMSSAGSGFESAAEKNGRLLRQSVKTAVADFQSHADRLVKVQEDMAARFEKIRQANLQSADAAARQLEAIAKRQLESATQAADSAKIAAQRVAMSVGPASKEAPVISPADRVAEAQRRLIALHQNTANQRVAIEKDLVDKLDALRMRDMASAEASAKRLYELSQASRAAVTGGPEAVRPGQPSPAVGPSDDASRRAIETARDTADRITAISDRLNGTLASHRQSDTRSAAEHAKSQELFIRAIEVTERKAAEDRLAMQKQLAIDLETIEKARGIKDPPTTLTDAVAVQDAMEAAKRVSEIGKRARAEQEKAVREVEQLRAKQAAAEERFYRQQAAAQEKAAKEAERIRRADLASDDRDRKEAINARKASQRERERIEIENQRLARDAAQPWIEAYQREQTAHERAMTEMTRGRKSFVTGLRTTAEGIGALSRGAVLLGLANGEEMEKVIKRLAAVQAGIDTVRGTGQVLQGVAKTWEALRLITLGSVQAKRAEAAAGRVATASSADLSRALGIESLAAGRAAVAHQMLARARGLPVGAQPMVGPPPLPGRHAGGPPPLPNRPGGQSRAGGMFAAPSTPGAFVAGVAGSAFGMMGGGVAGAAAGHKMTGGSESGTAIGSVIGTVAGGIMGHMVATRLAATIGTRMAVGAAAQVGGGAAASATGAGAIGGSLGMLAGSATAAAAALAFAGKSAIEMGKDARKFGLGGGSEKGSYNDIVGGSKFNPFAHMVAWSARADAAQAEEKTKRMANIAAIFQLEVQHVRNRASIRSDTRHALRQIDRGRRDRESSRELEMARTPEQKRAVLERQGTDQRFDVRNAQSQVNKHQPRADESMRALMALSDTLRRMDSNPNTTPEQKAGVEKQMLGVQRDYDEHAKAAGHALAELEARESSLQSTMEQQKQLGIQIHAEKRANTLTEIRGIEDVINARMRERKELEDSFKTVKERFGAMNVLDQRRVIAAQERARKDPKNISRMDAELLGRVDTDENRRLISNRNIDLADRAGFDATFGQETKDKRKIIDQDIDQNFGALAQKSGQNEADLRKQAEQNQLKGVAKVNIVDQTQFQIESNIQEGPLIKRILDGIEAMNAERDERIRRGVEAGERERMFKETQDARQRAEERTADGG